MVGHGRSSAGSYLADPTSSISSHCASIVVTSTLRVNMTKGFVPYTYAGPKIVRIRELHIVRARPLLLQIIVVFLLGAIIVVLLLGAIIACKSM